jgi:hypothetical protein
MMSNPLMSPDAAWVIGTTLGAAISAAPAYIATKRSNRKVETSEHTEHEATRTAMVDALKLIVGPLDGRLTEMHIDIKEMRDWQAEHTTEHAVTALTRSPILEYRKES